VYLECWRAPGCRTEEDRRDALKVARATDPVRVGTITGTAGPYPVTFVTTLVDADGAPVSTVTGPTATLSGVVSNAGGAPNVKA
jgi:hypothetical protein